MPIELPPGIRIKENSRLAKLAAWKMNAQNVALVIGKTIHLHNVTAAQFLAHNAWVKHELKHVEQYARLGKVRFLSQYFWEWLRKGYYNISFEVEARAAEGE